MEEAFEEETPEEAHRLPETPLEASEGHLREWVTKGREGETLDEELEHPVDVVVEGSDEALDDPRHHPHPHPDVEEEEEGVDDDQEEEEKEERRPLLHLLQ